MEKFNDTDSYDKLRKLPPLNLGGKRSMTTSKLSLDNENKTCNTCSKKDVCMYKTGLEQTMQEISDILRRTDILHITAKCKKWLGNVQNVKEMEGNK